MTNHVHLIISSQSNKIENIVRDVKKFTSKQIIQAIKENQKESRAAWMLNIFGYTGRNNNNNKDFQFWLQYYHPIELYSNDMVLQRSTYLHENPVKAGLVWEPWHYKYSSAIDYYTNEKGLIKIERL